MVTNPMMPIPRSMNAVVKGMELFLSSALSAASFANATRSDGADWLISILTLAATSPVFWSNRFSTQRQSPIKMVNMRISFLKNFKIKPSLQAMHVF